MNIKNYILENWEKLPKSSFNGDECVIFLCTEDYNGGYGHHGYAGYGIDKEGKIVYAYSSGCSCNGSCGLDHVKDIKTMNIKDPDMFDQIDPEKVNFNELEVSFSDY